MGMDPISVINVLVETFLLICIRFARLGFRCTLVPWVKCLKIPFQSLWIYILFLQENQLDAPMYQIYFIFECSSASFGRSFRPSSGVQDCTYSLLASGYPLAKQTSVSV